MKKSGIYSVDARETRSTSTIGKPANDTYDGCVIKAKILIAYEAMVSKAGDLSGRRTVNCRYPSEAIEGGQ